MNRKKLKTVLSLFITVLIAQTNYAQTVTIGTQVWMTKNLNVDKFRNGDPIPQAKSNTEWEAAGKNKQPAWCYFDNDPANGAKYGKLYNWYAVNDSRGLAPAGYHIPSDGEWTQLTDYLGGIEKAGAKMKSTSGWVENENGNGNGTNLSGFSGLPGGYRASNGTFRYLGMNSSWWSSSGVNSSNAWGRDLRSSRSSLTRTEFDKKSGVSVRCLKY